MNGLSSRLRAYAELGRISNLPTCISNVLVGTAIGQWAVDPASLNGTLAIDQSGGAALNLVWACLCMAVAICFVYVGGMALNDYADRKFDQTNNPGRPIPSGRISVGQAAVFVVACFAVGLVMMATANPDAWQRGVIPGALPFGLLLLAAIVLYDFFHKRHPWSVVVMGTCRGLVYLAAAAAVAWPVGLNWEMAGTFAGLITLYTVSITIIARIEERETMDARRWCAIIVPLMILIVPVMMAVRIHGDERFASFRWIPAIASATLFAYWMYASARHVFAKPPQTRSGILKWLSGMNLCDCYFLCMLGVPLLAIGPAIAFAITIWGHRKISGT